MYRTRSPRPPHHCYEGSTRRDISRLLIRLCTCLHRRSETHAAHAPAAAPSLHAPHVGPHWRPTFGSIHIRVPICGAASGLLLDPEFCASVHGVLSIFLSCDPPAPAVHPEPHLLATCGRPSMFRVFDGLPCPSMQNRKAGEQMTEEAWFVSNSSTGEIHDDCVADESDSRVDQPPLRPLCRTRQLYKAGGRPPFGACRGEPDDCKRGSVTKLRAARGPGGAVQAHQVGVSAGHLEAPVPAAAHRLPRSPRPEAARRRQLRRRGARRAFRARFWGSDLGAGLLSTRFGMRLIALSLPRAERSRVATEGARAAHTEARHQQSMHDARQHHNQQHHNTEHHTASCVRLRVRSGRQPPLRMRRSLILWCACVGVLLKMVAARVAAQ